MEMPKTIVRGKSVENAVRGVWKMVVYVPSNIKKPMARKSTFARRRNCSKMDLGKKEITVYFEFLTPLLQKRTSCGCLCTCAAPRRAICASEGGGRKGGRG